MISPPVDFFCTFFLSLVTLCIAAAPIPTKAAVLRAALTPLPIPVLLPSAFATPKAVGFPFLKPFFFVKM